MLAVILVHFNNVWNSPSALLSKASAIGARCPQLFFIISAYLTWSTLEKKSVKYIDFLKKRYRRMAPLYYTASFVAVVIPVIRVFDISVGNYISHLLFLNGLNPVWCYGIMGVEWYIADLALFYLLVPLLRKLIVDLNKAVIAFLTTAILSSATLVFFNKLFATRIASDNLYESYFHTNMIVHQLPVMILGIVLYYLLGKIKKAEMKSAKVVLAYGIATLAISTAFIVLHLNKRYMTSSIVAGLLWGILFLLCSEISNSFFAKKEFKLFAFVGEHSYGIYCFHQIVINCMIKINFSISSLIQWILIGILILTISCTVGCIAEKINNKMLV